MTRKFILKKEYPNSCSLGTIFTEGSPKTFYASIKDGNQTIRRYSSYWNEAYFTKNPEYYEEVIERDYEILSFIANKNRKGITEGDIISLNKDNIFSGNSKDFIKISGSLSEALESDIWNIHSIKRLSDGEIFTIGDHIEFETPIGTLQFKFEKMFINSNYSLRLWSKRNQCSIEEVRKYKRNEKI